MAAKKPEATKTKSLFSELLEKAAKRDIDVRAEKLLREVGYRARSGRCRLNGRDVIIVDRELPLAEQVEFLAGELDFSITPGPTRSRARNRLA
jgi:hypothetical protein